jgi:hypothetical protein
MRKMPVLTMVCLAAFGLLALPVHSATVEANDTPDIVLSGGSVSFDLADFFASAEGELTYSAVGAAVSGSVATVDAAGTATFSAGGVDVESTVVMSAFVIGNGPAVDNNNRIAGKDGGNVFYNALVPGGVINSAVNLSGLPSGGGDGTAGGGTGGAALVATVASIDIAVGGTGLRMVDRAIADGGLNATLNANGSYSVSADADFSGAWLVTLGAASGDSMDAVHLLAAEAIAVSPAGFTAIPAGTLAGGTVAGGQVTIAAGQGSLAFGAPIAVGNPGDTVSLVLDYNATANAAIAAILFDGAVDPSNLAFANVSGANIQTGKTKSLSVSIVTNTGSVVPAFQVASTGGAASVTISNIAIVKAGPVVDYALNPNATAFASDLASIAGWGPLDGSAPVADGDNNFAAAGAGCMKLAGAAGLSNALMTVSLQPGSAVAECYAKAAAGAGVFALALTDGGALNSNTFVGALGADWQKVVCVTTPGAAATAYLVVQAAPGLDALVDDICVRVVDDKAEFADLSLLGL